MRSNLGDQQAQPKKTGRRLYNNLCHIASYMQQKLKIKSDEEMRRMTKRKQKHK